MLVNKELSQEIYDEAGIDRVSKAKSIIKKANVEIKEVTYDDKNNFEIVGLVNGNLDDYTTRIMVKDGEIEDISCECQDYYNRYGACKHIVATLMKFEQNKYWDKSYTGEKQRPKNTQVRVSEFKKIISSLYNEEFANLMLEDVTSERNVRLEPKLNYDKYENKLELEFRVGINRMYKIRDLLDFYNRMLTNEFYKYGEKLEFVHTRENFEEKSLAFLDFIQRYAEMLKYAESINKYTYYYGNIFNTSNIAIGENLIDDVFDILKGVKDLKEIQLIEKNPNIKFEMTKIGDEYIITPNEQMYGLQIFEGKKFTYILSKNKLYRCDKKFVNTTLKLIRIFRQEHVTELKLEKEDIQDLYSILIPKIGNCIEIKENVEKELEEYKPKKLGVKVYLDFDENDYIISDVKFCYGDEEFNPLEENIQVEAPRNFLEENRDLNIFRKTGFMIDKRNTRFILPDEENIYNFLSKDIEEYMKKFEVLATDNFKTKEIKKPKLGTIGVRVENNLLEVDLSKINIAPEEMQAIMEKYKMKKKYHRLKDGSFLNLEENQDIEFLDKLVTGMDLEYKSLGEESIRLPINRTLYLNELLKNDKYGKVTKNGEFKKIVDNLEKNNINEEIKIPESMENILRDYQKIGYRWLKVLDSYRFGGILADDMGLGKTLQVISIVSDYIKNDKENKRTTLVVSPSSLTLNWKNEVKKFAPNLDVQVVRGKAEDRKRIISELENYDIIITSYDLLKRDIKFYQEKNYQFRYIIADEAQYMKNSTTQNAKSIKLLNGDARFALTGTPVENSLSELWSIFDFVMPGYLFGYKKFKSLYEQPIVKEDDEKAMNKLKMLIEPFILRRNKKDVLTELPEKTITVINNQMTDEQENIYLSYLAQIKEEVATAININGFEKSQIQILAALTRLRQICCHPGLFLKNYDGESSKLTQCLEIVDEAIQSGHKILLFSTYTSMFDILEENLKKSDIQYYKLTGSTKVDERIQLVDEFNSNPDVKIFLISLKAGGTGLNLTGADIVIHYDPWWNQSAENQATDRAYRIGQKNNVQVYKLITSNSIEEKIYELQQKKAELIDNILDTKASFINKLSKDEILALFE